jgi:hypothetical protein
MARPDRHAVATFLTVAKLVKVRVRLLDSHPFQPIRTPLAKKTSVVINVQPRKSCLVPPAAASLRPGCAYSWPWPAAASVGPIQSHQCLSTDPADWRVQDGLADQILLILTESGHNKTQCENLATQSRTMVIDVATPCRARQGGVDTGV